MDAVGDVSDRLNEYGYEISGMEEASEGGAIRLLFGWTMDTEELFLRLLSADLTLAEVLDYWACNIANRSVDEWSDIRGVSSEAIYQNRSSAMEKLGRSVTRLLEGGTRAPLPEKLQLDK